MPVSFSGSHVSSHVGWTCCGHPTAQLWEAGRATSGPEVDLEEARAAALPTANPPPAFFTGDVCVLAARSTPSWDLPLCALKTTSPLRLKRPGVPRVTQPGPSREEFHRGALPLSPLRKGGGWITARVPTLHLWGLLSITEVTFTYHVIHHVNHFQVQFSGS